MPDRKNDLTFEELEEKLAADFAENATREELDTELARMGIDTETVASRARQIAAERGVGGESQSWQQRAREKLASARDRMRGAVGRYADMTREQLLGRLEELKNHPSLAKPVTAAFRKRSAAESTDDELRAILADMDALVAIAGNGENTGEHETESDSTSSDDDSDK